MTRQQLENERRTLDGNLNRIFVTDDRTELEDQARWAENRLHTIIEANRERINLIEKGRR